MILEFLLLGCGIYIIYQNVRMRITNEVPKGLVNPKVNLESAPDTAGYIKYTFIRGLICGIILAIFSIVWLLRNNEILRIPDALFVVSELIFIVTLIYYSVISVKAQNKFLFKNSQENIEKKRTETIKRAAGYVNPAAEEEDKND